MLPDDSTIGSEKEGYVESTIASHISDHGDGPELLPEDRPSTEIQDPEETYPEGGLRAWLVVLGSWMALFSSLGLMNTMATFQTYIATNQLQGYSAGTIGWIFSLYAFLCFFCGIYIGPIFDKHGPRWLVFGGTICLVASIMLMSICTGTTHVQSPSFFTASLSNMGAQHSGTFLWPLECSMGSAPRSCSPLP